MYTLSKAVCWTTGLSPGIQMPKTSSLVAPVDPQDELTNHLAARVKLAAIEEQIFTELYSGKPGSCMDTQAPPYFTRSHQKLESPLRKWVKHTCASYAAHQCAVLGTA